MEEIANAFHGSKAKSDLVSGVFVWMEKIWKEFLSLPIWRQKFIEFLLINIISFIKTKKSDPLCLSFPLIQFQ